MVSKNMTIVRNHAQTSLKLNCNGLKENDVIIIINYIIKFIVLINYIITYCNHLYIFSSFRIFNY